MSASRDFQELISSVRWHLRSSPSEGRALLQWFLFNVFRLDEVQAQDSLCDRENDKGIDGLWVDEETEEIYLFQSKFTANASNTQGDRDLRSLVGSAQAWFSSAKSVRRLLKSSANPDLKALVKRCEVTERLKKGYALKLVFVTTRSLNRDGREYLETVEPTQHRIDLWDQVRLVGQHKSLRRKTRIAGNHVFGSVSEASVCTISGTSRLLTAYVPANSIAAMNGIADRSLFSLNVRYGLGRTRVNRELEAAVKERKYHQHFKIFHNGLTVICKQFAKRGNDVEISDYSIVNGCQSAITFFDNRNSLTNRLKVLVRIIEVGEDDALAEEITYRTNNQNGINLRDLRSNDRIQVGLQQQFRELLGNRLEYEIKAGERSRAAASISNDRAGQLIMALYRDEPYNAHQKYRIFGPDYERVFARDIGPEEIYLAYLMYTVIESLVQRIEDELVRGYQLTRFILLGLLGGRLRRDELGKALLESPEKILPREEKRLIRSMRTLAAHMIQDFNFYLKERQREEEYYDYKSEFKSPQKYGLMKERSDRDYEHTIVRYTSDSVSSVLKRYLSRRGIGSLSR